MLKKMSFLTLVFIGLGIVPALAFPIAPSTTLQPADPGQYRRFGREVAISGNYAIATSSNGTVTIFHRELGEWKQQQELTVPEQYKDHSRASNFGTAVAITDELAIVTNSFEGDESGNRHIGAVYVFRRVCDHWEFEKRIEAPPTQENPGFTFSQTGFGDSVAAWGDVVVVGAKRNSEAATNAGAVYIFARRTEKFSQDWVMEEALFPPDPVDGEWFGSAVDIDRENVVVGAHFTDSATGENTGAAYIYNREGGEWVLKQTLQPEQPTDREGFGHSVSIHDDRLAIGTSRADDITPVAYLYQYDNDALRWESQGGIWPVDTHKNYKQNHVALTKLDLLVAAGIDSTPGTTTLFGTALYNYALTDDGVGEQVNVQMPNPAAIDTNGQLGIAADGDAVIIGMMTANVVGIWSGAAYLYNSRQQLEPLLSDVQWDTDSKATTHRNGTFESNSNDDGVRGVSHSGSVGNIRVSFHVSEQGSYLVGLSSNPGLDDWNSAFSSIPIFFHIQRSGSVHAYVDGVPVHSFQDVDFNSEFQIERLIAESDTPSVQECGVITFRVGNETHQTIRPLDTSALFVRGSISDFGNRIELATVQTDSQIHSAMAMTIDELGHKRIFGRNFDGSINPIQLLYNENNDGIVTSLSTNHGAIVVDTINDDVLHRAFIRTTVVERRFHNDHFSRDLRRLDPVTEEPLDFIPSAEVFSRMLSQRVIDVVADPTTGIPQTHGYLYDHSTGFVSVILNGNVEAEVRRHKIDPAAQWQLGPEVITE